MRLKNYLLIVTSIFLVIILISCDNNKETSKPQNEANDELIVYSGAGLRKPMDELGDLFFKKYGISINYNYAGAGQSLSQIEVTRKGDVFVPGSKYYLKVAEEKDLIELHKDLVYHIPVIAVYKDSDKNIKSIEDLAKSDIKLILGDEEACAIGKVTKKMFIQNDILEKVQKNIVSKGSTVNEVVIHTAMGQADACIVWEDNVINNEDLNIVDISKEKNIVKKISAGLLSFSKNKEVANKYIEFISSEEGKKIFTKYGFRWIE